MIKKAIVLPDIHAPLHNGPALNVVLQAIPIIKPDVAVLLGDVGELESVSSWKYKKIKRPNLEDWMPKIDTDLDSANGMLDLLDTAFAQAGVQEKHFCEGNHEVWLDNFVEEHPYLPQYSPYAAFNLADREYKYYPYGEYFKIGELFFYHGGHYSGKYHALHHVLNLQDNVIYAHMHNVSRECIGGLNGVHAGFCIGSLKCDDNENNKWLRGRKTNWSHAFAIVYFRDDGAFRVEVVDITDGWTVLYGKEINGH